LVIETSLSQGMSKLSSVSCQDAMQYGDIRLYGLGRWQNNV